MTTRANLYVDQGVDFVLRLSVMLDEQTTEGLTFYSSARKVYSTDKLFDMDIVVEEGEDDCFDISLIVTAEKSVDIKPGKYQYDLIYINEENVVKKLLEGLLIIIPTITKPV
jgi:hypothetical protein